MENKDKNRLVEHLARGLEKTFDKFQERDHQYVVEYRLVENDKLLGYHASTFCQLVDDRLSAKRYAGENAYSQLETISRNLKSTLESSEHDGGLFGGLVYNVKQTHFEDLNIRDIYLEADYLKEGVEKQKFTYTILNTEEQ